MRKRDFLPNIASITKTGVPDPRLGGTIAWTVVGQDPFRFELLAVAAARREIAPLPAIAEIPELRIARHEAAD